MCANGMGANGMGANGMGANGMGANGDRGPGRAGGAEARRREFAAARREFEAAASRYKKTMERLQRTAARFTGLSAGPVGDAIIEQAKGILMARHECSADEAAEILRRDAERAGTDIHDMAERITGAAAAGSPLARPGEGHVA